MQQETSGEFRQRAELPFNFQSFRSSRAERSADNRQTTGRYRAEGPAWKLSEESAPLKTGRGRCNSVASRQSFCCSRGERDITRPCEGRVFGASPDGNASSSFEWACGVTAAFRPVKAAVWVQLPPSLTNSLLIAQHVGLSVELTPARHVRCVRRVLRTFHVSRERASELHRLQSGCGTVRHRGGTPTCALQA
jgi:hypothetical protein